MIKAQHLIVMVFALSILGGCTNYVRSDVTRFHNMVGETQAKTFVFLPNEAQFKSLEYKSYGELIRQQMSAAGFRLVENKAQANYGVRFNYGSDGGRTVIEQDPFFGSVGVGTGSRGTGVNVGVGHVFGRNQTTTDIYTEYSRKLSLDIVELKTNSPIFEGTVLSRGNTASFAPVSGCLIAAMFENFPGESGKTERVSVDVESCKK